MTPEEQVRLARVEEQMRNHRHFGNEDQRVNISDIIGLIRTVSTAPTHTPRTVSEQFVIYTSGATYRLYIYDTANNAWRYVALT